MGFGMSLLELITLSQTDLLCAEAAARKLIVPWSRERFPPSPEPSEAEGFYPGYFPPIFRADALASIRQMPSIGKVVFDPEGLIYINPSAFDELVKTQDLSNGLVNAIIGLVPPGIILVNLKGRPIPEKGAAVAMPKQYVYLSFFMGKIFGFWPELSGRKPVSENNPILYFARPTERGEEEICGLIPSTHLFEVPRMVTVYHS